VTCVFVALAIGVARRRARSELAGVPSAREAGIPPSSEGDKELKPPSGFEVVEAGAELFEEARGGREVLFETRDVGVR
jgi:hypothetical protein